jgi:hypothetical protein
MAKEKKEKEKAGGDASTSNHCYIMDKDLAWIPACLLDQKGDVATVKIPTYPDEGSILNDGGKGATSWREEKIKLKGYAGGGLPIANVDGEGMLIEKEDMVDLPFLHEVRTKESWSFLRINRCV